MLCTIWPWAFQRDMRGVDLVTGGQPAHAQETAHAGILESRGNLYPFWWQDHQVQTASVSCKCMLAAVDIRRE